MGRRAEEGLAGFACRETRSASASQTSSPCLGSFEPFGDAVPRRGFRGIMNPSLEALTKTSMFSTAPKASKDPRHVRGFDPPPVRRKPPLTRNREAICVGSGDAGASKTGMFSSQAPWMGSRRSCITASGAKRVPQVGMRVVDVSKIISNAPSIRAGMTATGHYGNAHRKLPLRSIGPLPFHFATCG